MLDADAAMRSRIRISEVFVTAEIYNKVKPHLAKATVAIPQKDAPAKPYVSKEGRYDAAVDYWPLPASETHFMRIVTGYKINSELMLIEATADMQFRPRESNEESAWSTYRNEVGSAFIQKENRDHETYLVEDAIEKAVTGATVRVLGLAGIGTLANYEDMPQRGQQRQAPAPQQAPTQQPLPAAPAQPKQPVDPWPQPYTKLTEKAKLHVRKTILDEVEASDDDLDTLIDLMLTANPNTTANEILAQVRNGG